MSVIYMNDSKKEELEEIRGGAGVAPGWLRIGDGDDARKLACRHQLSVIFVLSEGLRG